MNRQVLSLGALMASFTTVVLIIAVGAADVLGEDRTAMVLLIPGVVAAFAAGTFNWLICKSLKRQPRSDD